MATPADLKRLRVLVVQVHAYGNLGDELETAPLFYKLTEWGVGTVDAVLSQFTLSLCDGEKTAAPHIKGESYLLNSSVRAVHEKMPSDRYDIAIIAPGPDCPRSVLRQASKCAEEVIPFGVSVGDNTPIEALMEAGSSIRRLAVREPFSESRLRQALQPSHDASPPRVMMSGDIGFSCQAYLDRDVMKASRRLVAKTFPNRFSLVFPRAFGKGKNRSHVFLQRNGSSGSLELWTDENSKLAFFDNDVVVATTDLPVDRTMMWRSGKRFPDVPHITCNRVEHLLALVEKSSSVHTTRYHPGIAALMLDVPLTVLPHPNALNKMEGLKLMQEGLAKGLYEKNNDTAWSFLRSALEEKALEKRSAQS